MPNLPETASGAISFTYLAEIAVGATARVDLCRAADGRLLAVKRLHPHIAEDPGFATQFLDEVWMTASLKHPNVVEVAGWGADDQGSYLAVELVQGVSLSRLMKTVFDTGEQFTERMVVYIAAQLSSGLSAAHDLRSGEGELLNLVHRDLTPANVLLGFNGEVKIADFGLAKAKLRLTKTLTGLLKGQPTYMAPEQAKALDIDKRADLFSLGIVMFELFAGRRPWLGQTDYEMMQRTANDPPADLRELRPKIDKELIAIVNRCLEKDPAQRFQNVEEIQARLDDWLRAHGYLEGSLEALARFVRRNAMRQMRWFERAVSGELAPQAPAKVGRAIAPRVPSYANVTGLVERERDVRTTRGATPESRRPRVLEEQTDVSDASVQMAQIHASTARAQAAAVEAARRGVPVIRDAIAESESDWGEEVPTLVQKNGPAPIGRRRTGVTPAGHTPETPKKLPSIVDEESDQRTTAVKNPNKPALMGGVPPRAPGGSPGAGISDVDSEEFPTIPATHGRPGQPPLAPSPAGARPPTVPPPRRGSSAPPPGGVLPGRVVPKAPNVPTPPVGFAARNALPQTSPGRSPSSAYPAPPMTPLPPANGGAALARSAVEAVRAAVFAATAEHARISQHSTADEMSPAPAALRRPPMAEPEVQGPGGRPINQDMLLAEADRLAIEAVRRAEEAKTSALRAERKAAQAKLANDAALVAAEAVRLAQTSGLAAGAARLEDAHQIEQRMLSGGDGPSGASGAVSLGPKTVMGLGPPQGLPSSPPQSMHGSVPPQPFGIQGHTQPLPNGMSMPPSVPPPSSMSVPPLSRPDSPWSGDASRPSLDPLAFQNRLKPSLLRLNGYTLVALAVAAFAMAFLVLWAFFG